MFKYTAKVEIDGVNTVDATATVTARNLMDAQLKFMEMCKWGDDEGDHFVITKIEQVD